MKSLLFTIIIFIVGLGHAQQPDQQKLTKTLDSIYEEDQKYRKQIRPIIEEHGQKSEEFQELAMTMVKTDASNLLVVKDILNQYGWLGPDVVGKKGSQTLFLVIQHSDLETQQKYLPMMKKAVEEGDAKSQNFALLKDRVLLGVGEKQLYGSQIAKNQEKGEYYVQPIEDPENVNKRRQEMGLGPIEDYVSRWGIDWDADKYIENAEQRNGNQN
jgi:hypothetical protein